MEYKVSKSDLDRIITEAVTRFLLEGCDEEMEEGIWNGIKAVGQTMKENQKNNSKNLINF